MINYLIVIEETETGFSAFSPELDGCIATGKSRDDVEINMKDAIQFHIEGLKEDGFIVPTHRSYPAYC